MGTTVVPVHAQVPEVFRKFLAQHHGVLSTELVGGVQEGFPIIRYKGKVWGVSHKGELTHSLDENGHARPAIEVVMVRANPTLSKIYYEGAYEEGSSAPPDCFSNMGDVPDVSAAKPQARTCAVCPRNVWGSKITPAGKKTKACQDSRRVAVVFADQLAQQGAEAPVLLLRVPPASLKPVKTYNEALSARGIPFFGVTTLLSFDPQEAHPQFVLKPKRMLDEQEAEAVMALREDDVTMRVLAEALDHDTTTASPTGAGELTEGEETEEAEPAPAPQPAPAKAAAAAAPAKAAAPKTKAAPRPATEEEAGADLLAGLETPQPAAAPAKAAAPKAAAKAAPAAPAAPAKAAAPKAAAKAAPAQPAGAISEDEMGSLLDSILG